MLVLKQVVPRSVIMLVSFAAGLGVVLIRVHESRLGARILCSTIHGASIKLHAMMIIAIQQSSIKEP